MSRSYWRLPPRGACHPRWPAVDRGRAGKSWKRGPAVQDVLAVLLRPRPVIGGILPAMVQTSSPGDVSVGRVQIAPKQECTADDVVQRVLEVCRTPDQLADLALHHLPRSRRDLHEAMGGRLCLTSGGM